MFYDIFWDFVYIFYKEPNMKNRMCIKSWILTITTLLLTFRGISSFSSFQCKNNKGNVPSLPQSYSANIRINDQSLEYTIEMKYATNEKEGKEFMEFKRQDRHVQYIRRADQKSLLYIEYKEDEQPTCKVIQLVDEVTKVVLESEDSGENEIIFNALQVMKFPDKFNLYSIEPSLETGVYAMRYEACLSEPKLNISMSFAATNWKQPHISHLVLNVNYPERVLAEAGNVLITAFYNSFDPTTPDDAIFQPPSDVYCKGFRTNKKPPELPNYFSYNAEIIVYENTMGIYPAVSQRKVYYDYPSNISRIDSYDPLAEDADLFSRVTSQEESIIHDFNAGIQYIFDPITGKCSIDTFQARFNAIDYEISNNNEMLKGREYFWLKESETSYNGQFSVRGMTADVYTALRVDPLTKKNMFVSWYFSTEGTQLVENENVEKNVLLRMHLRPETTIDKKGVIEVNFYNFAKEEPNVFTYDLTSCFNDSSAKILVFTFPAIDSLKGSEKLIGMLTHLAIKDATGVSKQRIYMKEVIFSGAYIYAEFSLLEEAPVKGKVASKDISLDDALKKLRASVENGDFAIKIPSGKETVTLKPEPNGLNIFAGDRNKNPSQVGYKESSVILLTIGMLILGFVLGSVTLNLIISRKFGVSLFQKARYGNSRFSDEHDESNM